MVEMGQELCVVEAMKMQNVVRSTGPVPRWGSFAVRWVRASVLTRYCWSLSQTRPRPRDLIQ